METSDKKINVKVSFDRYTKKELVLLRQYIEKEIINVTFHTSTFCVPIRDALRHCTYDIHRLSSYPFSRDTDLSIFNEDLKRMPLHLNDDNIENAAIAKWRLRLGR